MRMRMRNPRLANRLFPISVTTNFIASSSSRTSSSGAISRSSSTLTATILITTTIPLNSRCFFSTTPKLIPAPTPDPPASATRSRSSLTGVLFRAVNEHGTNPADYNFLSNTSRGTRETSSLLTGGRWQQHPKQRRMSQYADADADAVEALAERMEDAAVTGSSFSKRGGKGGRGAGGGRGGGSRGGDGGGRGRREVDLSRALSRLLRHQAGNAGIQLDREGYANLERVLQWGPLRSLAPTFDEILHAVHNSDKQRFAIKPDPATNPALDEASTDLSHWLIRANQGHSIKLDSEHLLKPLALPLDTEEGSDETGTLPEGTVPIPPAVIHGTYFAFWPAIVASGGLRPMGRNHVHFSTGLPEDSAAGVVSGMRRDAEVLVYVDVAASMRECGIKWWVSENGVVLTEGDADGLVPLRFFREVRGRAQGVGLLWQDGEKVADLPGGLKVRAPQGKRPGRGGGSGGGGRGK